MAKSLWFCISNAPYSSIQYSVIHCQSITTDTEEVENAIFLIICMCTNEVVSCLLSKFLKSLINRNTNQCVMYLSKALMSWKHDNLFSCCPQQGWITPVEMTHLCLTSPWSCACCMHKEKDCLCCLKERTQSASVDVSVRPAPSLYFRHGGWQFVRTWVNSLPRCDSCLQPLPSKTNGSLRNFLAFPWKS